MLANAYRVFQKSFVRQKFTWSIGEAYFDLYRQSEKIRWEDDPFLASLLEIERGMESSSRFGC